MPLGKLTLPESIEDPVAIIKGEDAALITRRAIEALGGIEKFVSKGDIVVIKPNMSWDRRPKQAATTNPKVVEEVVKMCFEAGAKKVKAFDRPCANAKRSYQSSKIPRAARRAGAEVFQMDDWNFKKAEFDYESPVEGWPIYRDVLRADCFINIPILKHHNLTGLTISMKNLMGVVGGNRGQIHRNISEKLAHFTDFISPDLNIVDATRVLVRNGPSGGSLEDVEIFNTVIASRDAVLADSKAAVLLGKKPENLGFIVEGNKLGVGNIDVKNKNIIKQSL
ncbi:MAG: DUF362 domain-containing protein [Elusimicrobiota bacterium]